MSASCHQKQKWMQSYRSAGPDASGRMIFGQQCYLGGWVAGPEWIDARRKQGKLLQPVLFLARATQIATFSSAFLQSAFSLAAAFLSWPPGTQTNDFLLFGLDSDRSKRKRISVVHHLAQLRPAFSPVLWPCSRCSSWF